MIDRFKIVFKSTFVQNVAKLTSGTVISQLISLATAPVLYRMYEKDSYAVLGLYMGASAVLGTFSTMQLSQAILLEKEDQDAINVIWLVRIINLFFSVLTLFIVLFFGEYISTLLRNNDISFWFYFLPVTILFSGQNEIYRVWANRRKCYNIITLNTVLLAVITPSIMLGFVFLGFTNELGIMTGFIVGQIIPTVLLGLKLNGSINRISRNIHFKNLIFTLRKHISFPKYTMPSEFINRLSNQLPIFLLSHFVGSAYVAAYNLSIRMLAIPVQFLGSSISEVFRQKAVDDLHTYGNCRTLFIKTLITLGLFALLPLIVTSIFAPTIFRIAFGENWILAGKLAQLFSFLYFLKLIVSPLSYLYILANKQKEDFYWHIWILISNALILYIGFSFLSNIDLVLILFVANYCFIYLIYLFNSYKYSFIK